jgi:hypothetical protein
MKSKGAKKLLLVTALVSAIALPGSNALADSAANIFTYASGTAVVYDDNGSGNFPVITAILSAPSGSVYNPGATLDGYTYRNWSYLAADTTGSLDMFYSSSLVTGYTPTVGDTILVQGNYSPFDGIPEIGNSTAHPISVTFGSSGNPFYSPSPVLTTIPTINVGTNSYGLSQSGLGGQLLQLNNVTISGVSNATAGSTTILANWATHANNQGAITDQGGHSMIMYLWASSYSTAGAIAAGGGPIPTGLVDMTGFVSVYNSIAEFTPTSISPVPEPGTLALSGMGGLLLALVLRRRNV